jgi:hypothetical protein
MVKPLLRTSTVAATLFSLSCGDHDHPRTLEADKSVRSLVGLEDWSPNAREQDPFVTEDSPPACEQVGVRVEEEQGWLELDTNECSFITVIAGARYAVEEGDELTLDVSHFDLDAAEPATAELRLRFGSCEVWEKSIPIPSAANVYSERFASPCSIAPGGQLLFHVENHGQNTYQLRSLTVLR